MHIFEAFFINQSAGWNVISVFVLYHVRLFKRIHKITASLWNHFGSQNISVLIKS